MFVSNSGFKILSQFDLGGHGDAMHVNVVNDVAYIGHMGGDRVGTSIVDVSDPTRPELIHQLTAPPGTHTHKVQVVDDLMLVNYERNSQESNPTNWRAGMAIWDVSTPSDPQEVSFFEMPGKGLHRMTWFGGPLVYASGSDTGFTDQFMRILDISSPEKPVEVGRWWPTGMHEAAGESLQMPAGRRSANHHTLLNGDIAYSTWWDDGLYILDVADPSSPKMLSHVRLSPDESRCTHTALPLPGTDLLIITDEAMGAAPPVSDQRHVWVYNVKDPTNPVFVSRFPVPSVELLDPSLRFGPHNLHEMRPGSFQSDHLVHLTYFAGGLRVVDVSDPSAPVEVAHCIPSPPAGQTTVQFNDIYVNADGLVFVTDRNGAGLYILEPTF